MSISNNFSLFRGTHQCSQTLLVKQDSLRKAELALRAVQIDFTAEEKTVSSRQARLEQYKMELRDSEAGPKIAILQKKITTYEAYLSRREPVLAQLKQRIETAQTGIRNLQNEVAQLKILEISSLPDSASSFSPNF